MICLSLSFTGTTQLPSCGKSGDPKSASATLEHHFDGFSLPSKISTFTHCFHFSWQAVSLKSHCLLLFLPALMVEAKSFLMASVTLWCSSGSQHCNQVSFHSSVLLKWCSRFKFLSYPLASAPPHWHACLGSYKPACVFLPDCIFPTFLPLSLEPFHIPAFWCLNLSSDTLIKLEKSTLVIWRSSCPFFLNRCLSFCLIVFAV